METQVETSEHLATLFISPINRFSGWLLCWLLFLHVTQFCKEKSEQCCLWWKSLGSHFPRPAQGWTFLLYMEKPENTFLVYQLSKKITKFTKTLKIIYFKLNVLKKCPFCPIITFMGRSQLILWLSQVSLLYCMSPLIRWRVISLWC